MSAYEDRVIELEKLGCTTSDAQSVADCEVLDGVLAPPNGDYILHAAFELIDVESVEGGDDV